MKQFNSKFKVMIFPAGSEIGLEIYNSLKYNLHVELFGISGKSDHAKYIYDKNHYFEGDYYIDKTHFLKIFNSLIEKLHIDFIFPTHDSIALYLAKHQHKIKAKVLTSPIETTLIAREKKLTYKLFKDCNFCPIVYNPPYKNCIFPLFVKPNEGQGGKGSFIAHSKFELSNKLENTNNLVVMEYLPGDELSVDCFTNRHGDLLFVGPRTRERITMGISFRSSIVELTDEINEIAKEINKRVKIKGAWFFQVKKDKNQNYKLMEFAVRQASTMGVYRQIGINFALLSLFDALEHNVKIIKNVHSVELDRCYNNSYKTNLIYDKVYFDFDDTLIINNQVNCTALRFLYQCKNRSIKIILLTKHEFKIKNTLKKYCISEKLFYKIIVIKASDDKLNFIEPKGAIYIDNYFFDREKVFTTLHIPVFDVDAIECLLE